LFLKMEIKRFGEESRCSVRGRGSTTELEFKWSKHGAISPAKTEVGFQIICRRRFTTESSFANFLCRSSLAVRTVEPLYKHRLGTKDRMLISQVMLIPRGI
jgi:hypothetical protein